MIAQPANWRSSKCEKGKVQLLQVLFLQQRLSSSTKLWWQRQIDSLRLVCFLSILLLKRRRSSRLLSTALTFQGNIPWKVAFLLWCLLKVTTTTLLHWLPLTMWLQCRMKRLCSTCFFVIPLWILSDLWSLPKLARADNLEKRKMIWFELHSKHMMTNLKIYTFL